MQKWEYKIITADRPTEEHFNELGGAGWERSSELSMPILAASSFSNVESQTRTLSNVAAY